MHTVCVPQGGADLRFRSSQPNISLYCKTTDTGLVHRAVCLFTLHSFTGSQVTVPTDGGMARPS